MKKKILSLDELRENLDDVQERMREKDAAIQAAGPEVDEETLESLEAAFEELETEAKAISAAIDRQERMEAALSRVPKGPKNKDDGDGRSPAYVYNEPRTYRSWKEGGQHSFFVDLSKAAKGDPKASARLARHDREMQAEIQNAVTTASSSGGAFAPPSHLQSLWAELARAGRPFANRVRNLDLPDVGMALTVPRVTQGTLTATQTTQNAALANQDLQSTELSIEVVTIGGYVEISRQAFDRSQPGLDEVIMQDLARDYAIRLDSQILNGTGNGSNALHAGILQNSDVSSITYTDASPTVGEVYAKIADAVNRVHSNRFLPPTGIFMHPRRWAFFLAAVDASQRPVIAPVAPQNNPGNFGFGPEDLVGTLQGLPVYLDANIPANLGASTDEDVILVSRLDDQILWERGAPAVEVSHEEKFRNATVVIRAFDYSAFTSARYSKSSTKIVGTGLKTPTF